MAVLWVIVIFPLLWSFSSACEVNQKCEIDLHDPLTKALLDSMENVSNTLLVGALGDGKVKVDAVFSNISIYIIITLMLFGAAGKTQSELITALGFPDAEIQKVQTSFLQILNALRVKHTIQDSNSKEIIVEEVKFSNGIFIQEGLSLVQEYSNFISQIKDVEILYANFAQNLQGANDQIADWIKRNNPGHDEMWLWATASAATKILLTNELYFRANWVANLFLEKNTKLATFNSVNGPHDVPMMRTVKQLMYFQGENTLNAVQLPFEGGDYVLIIMVPQDNITAIDLLQNLTPENCNRIIQNSELKWVDIQIPKFAPISFSINLGQILPKLNINELFKNADLSNMLANSSQEKFGVESFHAAVFSMDENGMMAAGVSTGAGEHQELSSNPPETISFIADRPFYGAIMHLQSSIILLKAYIQDLPQK